jgi:hypothetical protein
METNENTETFEDINFGKEIAKTLVLSAASTAGVVVGMIAIGHAIDQFEKIKAKRAAKKAQKTN